jgi:hypothetical protein
VTAFKDNEITKNPDFQEKFVFNISYLVCIFANSLSFLKFLIWCYKVVKSLFNKIIIKKAFPHKAFWNCINKTTCALKKLIVL